MCTWTVPHLLNAPIIIIIIIISFRPVLARVILLALTAAPHPSRPLHSLARASSW
jgi:hypothetical protein